MSPRVHRLLRGVVAVGVLGASTLGNCFGATTPGAGASVEHWNRLLAPFYRDGEKDLVTVVLVDDGPWRRDRGGFLRYSEYDALLRRIAEAKPRAIFLDYVLGPRTPAADDDPVVLATTLRHITSEEDGLGIPVFLAVLNPCGPTLRPATALEASPGFGLRDEMVDLLAPKRVQPVVIEWSGYGAYYPLRLRPQALKREQPLCALAGHDAKPWLTPAAALYQALDGTLPHVEPPTNGEEADRDHFADEQMLVFWGAGVSEPMRSRHGIACPVFRGFRSRLSWSWLLLWEEGARLLPGSSNASLAGCTFADTLQASELMAATPDPALRNWIEDRAVLVGPGRFEDDDFVHSPVHGAVFGVHLHAMALDNLLRSGGRIYRAPKSWLGVPADKRATFVVGALLLVGLKLVQRILEQKRAAAAVGAQRWLPQVRNYLLALVAFVVLLGIAAYGFAEWWLLPPIDWVVLLGVFATVFSLDWLLARMAAAGGRATAPEGGSS